MLFGHYWLNRHSILHAAASGEEGTLRLWSAEQISLKVRLEGSQTSSLLLAEGVCWLSNLFA